MTAAGSPGRLGKSDEANTHFVAALRLATDELKRR